MDVSLCTVQHMQHLALQTGSVVRWPLQVGGPRLLNRLHASFLEGCIEQSPNIYLTELQDEL
ncbi:hypothetical protein BOTBODRAFT_624185 [Botryobasidium botryosum FD-172 SS1]|uniref:Uncharacterized protein n=1 Tax=Botryobasidium botryosum (strain FD-172 SS1) TaxID=930990 RepID=A0A067MVS9_BOTB1|nr:hypothetical protein BOTBODRAFT_624185 [Botryobasidium botryosum FD-172 SS1]